VKNKASAGTRPRIAGLVSVIIPAYNAAQSLGRCIDRVLEQTYPDVEMIVVDDGSTDSTKDVAAHYGDRIRYVFQENRGETAARNRGFQLARGEFVTFIDHDDYWEPEFVECTVRFLCDHPAAVAVSVGHEHQSALESGTTVRPSFLEDPARRHAEPILIDQFFDFWFEHNHICAGSAMLRGTLIDEAGGQREDLVLSGDMEYWAYLATFGQWGFIPKVLLNIDGTQVPRGNLYSKFHQRYQRCSTVESWETRIVPRLSADDRSGYLRIQGRVATWYTFAHVFVGHDREARRLAEKYKDHLEGKFGQLWQFGLMAGPLSWMPLCLAMRLRTRAQYFLADWRR